MKVTEALSTQDVADEASYTYTLNGKRFSLTDARGYRAEFRYDGHDRQIEWRFPDKVTPGVASATDRELYQLDNNGNRLALTKRDGQVIGYSYDLLNRVTIKDVPGAAGDVTYAYNNLGAQLSALFSASGQGLTTVYDALGRIISNSLNLDGVTRTLTYAYDLAGQRLSVTHPDSQQFSTVYDNAGRATLVRQGASNALRGYTYSAIGLLDGESNGAAGAAGTSAYGYDPVRRLTSLTRNLTGTANDVTWTFGYNPASQVDTQTRDNDAYAFTPAVASKSYAVNGLNQYTAVSGTTHTYDANGNLTSDGTTTYAYDVENRLTSATGATSATLEYDPIGRLYEVASGGATTRFLYDGDELAAEYNAAGTMLHRYVHGSSVDDPVTWYPGASVTTTNQRHLVADRQGSIVAVVGNTGSLLGVNRYDEYGNPTTSVAGSGQLFGRFGYTGQIWLPELKLWYYKARIYWSGGGRFLQTDPVGYEDQTNLYSYIGNDPINATDASGQACLPLLFNMGSGQCQRSRAYNRLANDPRISSRTTFFWGAGLVTAALANVNIPGSTVSSTTSGMLSRLGGFLSYHNNLAANAIASGKALSSGNVTLNDRAMVHYEQTLVQGFLNREQQSNPAFAGTIKEINSLLNGRAANLGLRIGDSTFRRALNETRGELGRDMDIGKQSDREALGDNVLEEVREICTGTRLCPNPN